MEKIIVSGCEPRKYTNAFYNWLLDMGYISEKNPLNNLLYWLSEDEVREYAKVNFDLWLIDEDEVDEDEEEDDYDE